MEEGRSLRRLGQDMEDALFWASFHVFGVFKIKIAGLRSRPKKGFPWVLCSMYILAKCIYVLCYRATATIYFPSAGWVPFQRMI